MAGTSPRTASSIPASGGPAGQVRICVADTQAQEAAVVADTLRRAHLADGVPWERMAVLVRSAQRQVPALRRALTAAGVPVTVAGDELPLPDEPGVRPLLTLLRCAARPGQARRRDRGRAADRPARPDRQPRPAEAAGAPSAACRSARCSPTCGRCARSATGWRRPPGGSPACSTRPAQQLDAGKSVEDVLWAVWRESGLGRAWEERAEHDSAADHDLDAVLALFEAAARFTDALPPGSAAAVPRQPDRPGDRRRHARRARGPRGLRPRADRPPVQGPRVGRGGRRRGAGRGLARPPAARLAARRRRARRGDRRLGDEHAGRRGAKGRRRRGARGPAARRGAAAVLRRGHAGEEAAHGDRVRRRRAGPAPVAVPRRARGRRHRDRAGQRRHQVAVPARARRGPAQDRGRPGEARRAAAGRRPPARQARGRGRARRRPGGLVRADRAVRRGPDRRRRRAGAAVAVARGDVHPLRPALAA